MPKNFSISLTSSSLRNDGPATHIVFGSPRGGTTMVAKVLQELSIDLGGVNANLEDPNFNIDYMNKQGIPRPEQICKLLASIEQNNTSKRIWGWKYPAAIRYLDDIWTSLLNPHLICIFRDPVAISLRNINKRKASPHNSLQGAIDLQQRNIKFLKSKPDIPQFICSYEKCLSNPLNFVMEISAFVGCSLTSSELQRVAHSIDPEKGYSLNTRQHTS